MAERGSSFLHMPSFHSPPLAIICTPIHPAPFTPPPSPRLVHLPLVVTSRQHGSLQYNAQAKAWERVSRHTHRGRIVAVLGSLLLLAVLVGIVLAILMVVFSMFCADMQGGDSEGGALQSMQTMGTNWY